MNRSDQPATNSPLDPVVNPISRQRILRISLTGFGLLVGLVLVAAYLGYRGSDAIQDTAQTMIHEAIAGGRGAALEARIVRESQELLDQLAWVLGLCFVLALGTAGLTVWTLQQAFSRLEWHSNELAHVSWHMIDTHENMARRFSHEMHDELGQSLSGLRRLLSRSSDKDLGGVRQECIEIVDEVLQNVRKLSQILRPVILDDFGLDSGLLWLCERFTQRTQIPVQYTSSIHVRLAQHIETHLFRITQEALTNIARHSGALHACVDLQATDKNVLLTISDDGKGFDPNAERQGHSLGMVGMRARARQIHGELIVENCEYGGMRIRVSAPLQTAEASHVDQEDPSFVG